MEGSILDSADLTAENRKKNPVFIKLALCQYNTE